MVDLSRDKANTDLLKDGAWVAIPDFAEVKLRRWRNREHAQELSRLYDAKREELKLSPDADLSEEVAIAVTLEATCRTVIMDWRGVENAGKPVAYTPETGIQVFGDEAWDDIFLNIVNASSARTNFMNKQKEVAVKNA